MELALYNWTRVYPRVVVGNTPIAEQLWLFHLHPKSPGQRTTPPFAIATFLIPNTQPINYRLPDQARSSTRFQHASAQRSELLD